MPRLAGGEHHFYNSQKQTCPLSSSDKPKQPLFSVAPPEKEFTPEEEKQVET